LESPYNTIEEYNPATNTWTAKSADTYSYNYGMAASVNGNIYFIGGESSVITGSNKQYSPGENSWTAKASMPTPRRSAAAAVSNNKIYLSIVEDLKRNGDGKFASSRNRLIGKK